MQRGESTRAFERWQAAQRQLHMLERQIRDGAAQHRAAGPHASDELRVQAQRLQLEVDALFPAAMKELEEQVSALKARRPRLEDLR